MVERDRSVLLVKTSSGWTPLYYSSHTGRTTIVNYLLKAGADPKIRTDLGHLPIFGAVSYGHTDIVELLLPYVYDVNERYTSCNATLLQWAENKHYTKIVKLLIDHGAKFDE